LDKRVGVRELEDPSGESGLVVIEAEVGWKETGFCIKGGSW